MIEGLKTLLEYFRDERHRREDKADAALAAIYAAANETKLYIRKAQRTGRSEGKKEEELSRLWTAAAVPIRHFDRDLADRCLMKGRYWVDPASWSVEDIVRFRIGIDEVFEEARELLQK